MSQRDDTLNIEDLDVEELEERYDTALHLRETGPLTALLAHGP